MTMKATDEELVALFSLDDVAELHSIAAGKRRMLFISTCDGQWAKYETDRTWMFHPDDPNDGDID